jgi:fumarylpyruvate hydrolase
MGPLTTIDAVPSLENGRIWLKVNDELKQEGDLTELIWSVREHVSILSRSIALAPGDLIMTGTPAGVGPVVPGDVITGGVEGLEDIRIAIGERQ